jgi:hypothetical protein
LHSIARRVNRIEKRLFLIEVGAIEQIPAIERISEYDDPSRFSGLAADLKLHWSHWLKSLAEYRSQDESRRGAPPDTIPIVLVLGYWLEISVPWGNIAPIDQNFCEVLHTEKFLDSDAGRGVISAVALAALSRAMYGSTTACVRIRL